MAQPIQSSATVTGAEYPSDEGIERRRHPRYRMDTRDDEPVQISQVDRRQRERRGIDEVRADLQRAYVPPPARGWVRNGWFGRSGIKPPRIFLLLVAITAGGLAFYLTTAGARKAPEVSVEATTEIVKEPRVRVLVARTAIGVGQHLLPGAISWEEWPAGAVLEDYITDEAAPNAVNTLSDTVARFEFFPGDPIREQKLVRAAQGYLSAVLKPGMRGVSVAVSAQTASGGFISPNDHVDVVLTRRTPGIEVSETILRNVRVLAINSRLGETGSTGAPENAQEERIAMFSDAIVTLELDEAGAQVIVGASALGSLTLVLRAMSDFSEDQTMEDSRSNQTIRLTSPFWNAAGTSQPR